MFTIRSGRVVERHLNGDSAPNAAGSDLRAHGKTACETAWLTR